MPITAETKNNIFSLLKKVMEESCPPLVITKNSKEGIEVIGNIPTPYGSKKVMVPGMYFASALIRKDNVSFYFFPIYYHEKDFEKLIPTLLKCLDGKTCFHFKKEEQAVEKEIKAMFKKGIEMYRKQGWVK
ncbi:MAG: DUF1801 domain-containing protein [Chitinophagales bacterium]|nr:DUF1801 domain-containing protein [Chitinophagales bacterium]